MLQLSRSRRSMPASLAVLLLSLAAPAAQAVPPKVTLSAPAGQVDANPPAFAGTAGTEPWASREVAVEIFEGESVADADLVQTANADVRESGAFAGTLGKALPDGTYTARARQTNIEREVGYTAPSVFTIGRVAPTPTPTPTPVPQAAVTPAPRLVARAPAG